MGGEPEPSRGPRLAAVMALLVAAGAVIAMTAPVLTPAPGRGQGAPADRAAEASGRGVAVASRAEAGGRLGAPAALPVRARTQRREAVPSRRRIASARRFLAARAGQTAFAVIDTRGRLTGLRSDEQFGSASVVKAMLLVAHLDALARSGTSLGDGDRALLAPMVRRSDNAAATAIYARVGDAGLIRLARRARMRRFTVAGYWANTRITAADQARFFLRLNSLLPARHRAYARGLLSGVVAEQSWGVPRAARPRWRVFFKGGWRPEPGGHLVHQVARLERGDRVVVIAVMTRSNPSHGYGTETVRGVAQRLLRAGTT